ncbi:MAG: hypothetical protein NWP61_02275 [Rickettsiaceae bacterium]|nr:hypothetical protein [Rickettsiaceae bacterium]
MELEIIFKALISLGVVFLAMYIVLKILQKYSNVGSHSKLSAKGSGLKIENIVYIDESTKVVNISNKSGSHYILAVSKNNSFLIDKYKTLTEEE